MSKTHLVPFLALVGALTIASTAEAAGTMSTGGGSNTSIVATTNASQQSPTRTASTPAGSLSGGVGDRLPAAAVARLPAAAAPSRPDPRSDSVTSKRTMVAGIGKESETRSKADGTTEASSRTRGVFGSERATFVRSDAAGKVVGRADMSTKTNLLTGAKTVDVVSRVATDKGGTSIKSSAVTTGKTLLTRTPYEKVVTRNPTGAVTSTKVTTFHGDGTTPRKETVTTGASTTVKKFDDSGKLESAKTKYNK